MVSIAAAESRVLLYLHVDPTLWHLSPHILVWYEREKVRSKLATVDASSMIYIPNEWASVLSFCYVTFYVTHLVSSFICLLLSQAKSR